MQVGILQKNHYDSVFGGGEISTKYWIEQAKKEGIDPVYIDYHTQELPDCDWYLVGDFTCHNQKVINKLLTRKFNMVVHNSLPWGGFEHIYSKSKKIWLLSPKHLELHRHYLANDNLDLVMPYVDHRLFKPKQTNVIEGTELYIGTISNNKIGQSMINYMETSDNQFHFYGEKVDFDFNNYNLFFFDKLNIKQVANTMQQYDTFFWYLDRFGGYGRTLIEAMLTGLYMNVNKENFGIFSYDLDFDSRQCLIDKLEEDLHKFWYDNFEAIY
jgi:hypothetical protein